MLAIFILNESSVIAGSSQRPGVTRDSKANFLGNEMGSGPSGSGHGVYQASAPHISGKYNDLSANLQVASMANHSYCLVLGKLKY